MVAKRSGGVRVAALVLVALSLAGCGSDESDPGAADGDRSTGSPSSSPTGADEPSAIPSESIPADAPGCAEVWQGGATLPAGYDGCVEDDRFVQRDALPCSSGQRIVTYADAFYAVPGGLIHEAATTLDRDRDYRAAVRRCRG